MHMINSMKEEQSCGFYPFVLLAGPINSALSLFFSGFIFFIFIFIIYLLFFSGHVAQIVFGSVSILGMGKSQVLTWNFFSFGKKNLRAKYEIDFF